MNRVSKTFDITQFGADPTGSTLSTSAFKASIEECLKCGEGTVYVPDGVFLTGPLELKSNIHLQLSKKANIIFSQNISDYPVIHSQWEGSSQEVYMPMIYGKNIENVSITGQGTLDGQGDFWWKQFKAGTLSHPRPRLVSFEDSSRITIDGIKLINSPAWTINPIRCVDIKINNVTVINPADSPNTDGINPDSSKKVHITNCYVDVGDDCIALKSGTEKCNTMVSCEDVTIENCTLLHGHGGVVIGSEMSGGVKNVIISNCVFEGTDRGIRLKTRRQRGGVVENILVTDLEMNNVMCPIVINQFYFCGEGGKDPSVQDKSPHRVTSQTPVFRNLRFCNIIARNTHASAAFIYGLPEMPVIQILFSHVSISMAKDASEGIPAMMSDLQPMKKKGIYCCNAKDIHFDHVTIFEQEGSAIELENSHKIKLSSCNFDINPRDNA
ncbi:MAG: glycoside hydrolase family 28 protein [Clostridium sp.]|jgi:polygalacturonase|nr:glycoside hydrolase family 28 protein [Clostridium sp.]